LHANTVTRLVVALSLPALVGFTVGATDPTAANEINTVLDDFNRAATNADFDGYFACLAPDAVLIGTDATERWTVDELRAFVKPHFDQGRGRAHTPRDRHVNLCPGGDDERDAPPADDDAGIRESLAAYLAAASFPEPKPIDPELFTVDIEALWSNGKTYRGRESVLKALQESQLELEEAFESFGARAEQVRVQRRGDVAWVTCRIKMNGTLTEGGGPFARIVRSTFVFEQQGHRWRMAHEHSSRLAQDQ
jgi:ketosteroid isomerase-like protein